MSVKRYWTMGRLNDFPDPDPMTVQKEVRLAADYDRLLSLARRLRGLVWMSHDMIDHDGTGCPVCAALAEADEVLG